jgi:hypothetical protein
MNYYGTKINKVSVFHNRLTFNLSNINDFNGKKVRRQRIELCYKIA